MDIYLQKISHQPNDGRSLWSVNIRGNGWAATVGAAYSEEDATVQARQIEAEILAYEAQPSFPTVPFDHPFAQEVSEAT